MTPGSIHSFTKPGRNLSKEITGLEEQKKALEKQLLESNQQPNPSQARLLRSWTKQIDDRRELARTKGVNWLSRQTAASDKQLTVRLEKAHKISG